MPAASPARKHGRPKHPPLHPDILTLPRSICAVQAARLRCMPEMRGVPGPGSFPECAVNQLMKSGWNVPFWKSSREPNDEANDENIVPRLNVAESERYLMFKDRWLPVSTREAMNRERRCVYKQTCVGCLMLMLRLSLCCWIASHRDGQRRRSVILHQPLLTAPPSVLSTVRPQCECCRVLSIFLNYVFGSVPA